MASIGSNTSKNIGPYYVGDTIHLVCVAYEGNIIIFIYHIFFNFRVGREKHSVKTLRSSLYAEFSEALRV